jgi:hypothetical protein
LKHASGRSRRTARRVRIASYTLSSAIVKSPLFSVSTAMPVPALRRDTACQFARTHCDSP